MELDLALFSLLNGLAGRWVWLDACGRCLAVYGLLLVLLGAITALWWLKPVGASRWAFVRGVLIAGGLCLALFALDWLLTVHVLGRPVRARPMNAVWTTSLIAVGSRFGFPAWPALIAVAIALPIVHLRRVVGLGLLAVSVMLGLSLVFVGVNYPLDVVTGLFIGATIGAIASSTAGLVLPRPRGRWRRPTVAAGAVVLWCGMLGVSLVPASTAGDAAVDAPWPGLRVTPPHAVFTAIYDAVNAPIALEAATNGRLLVASLRVTLPADVALADVRTAARRAAAAAFTHWPRGGLLTITVDAAFSQKGGAKLGTLYTATVDRAAWQRAGSSVETPLPGKKFFHSRYLAPLSAPASATNRR